MSAIPTPTGCETSEERASYISCFVEEFGQIDDEYLEENYEECDIIPVLFRALNTCSISLCSFDMCENEEDRQSLLSFISGDSSCNVTEDDVCADETEIFPFFGFIAAGIVAAILVMVIIVVTLVCVRKRPNVNSILQIGDKTLTGISRVDRTQISLSPVQQEEVEVGEVDTSE